MTCPWRWLVITDGTLSDAGIRNQVDLLSDHSGFCVTEWEPAITTLKGGGTWKDSSLAHGRRLALNKKANVVESMTVEIRDGDADTLIRDTQELRRLLEKARTYWTTNWQTEPVWLEAQGVGESNIRYTLIMDWQTPNDGNPYEQPFWQLVAKAGMDDFSLIMEREPFWRPDMPGESTCVAITGDQSYNGSDYGRVVATCLDEVYIANKHNQANITHIFTWSAANGFSANLQGGALPYDLIDIAGAAPAINDYVVFGVNAALADSGPFMSLVSDIGTAISGITLTTWEYSDGVPGWGAMGNTQDNTNADGQMTGNIFDTTGVKSFHFDPAADFLPQAENGVNGYWVRARITAVPGPHVAPTQQNRDVYSIVWPYIEVASTEVLGDVTALLRTQAYNQSDHDGGSTNLEAWASRFLISTRSVSRGSDFTPYLNLSAEQNPAGVTVTALGVGAFVVNPNGPTGFHLSVPAPAAAWADVARVEIDYPLSIEYDGRFRMLLRGDQSVAGDIQFRVNALFAGAAIYNTSDAVSFTNATNLFQTLDFGAIAVPAQVGSVSSTSIQFEIQVFGDAAASARLYDLILMPVDEYAIDTSELFYTDASRVYARGVPAERSYLDIDPITDPKQFATFIKQYANDRYTATWMNITPQKPVLQSNSRQRIWFLCWQYPTADDDPQDALPWIAHSIQMHKVQRYFSMRGAR